MTWRTSINLDEETHRIAKTMPNRSAFMRECIRRWHAAQSTTHIHPVKDAPRCYPHSKNGVCPLCWPNGILSTEDWKYYRLMSGQGHNLEEWANENIIRTYSWDLPQEIEKRPSKGGVKAFLRRFLRLKVK
jgi:hypothetical protein